MEPVVGNDGVADTVADPLEEASPPGSAGVDRRRPADSDRPTVGESTRLEHRHDRRAEGNAVGLDLSLVLRDPIERIARELPGHDLAVGVDGVAQLRVDDVEPGPTDGGVLRAVGMERDAVGARLAKDGVAAGAAVQEVAAGAARDPVVAAAPANGVGEPCPDQPVGSLGPRHLGRPGDAQRRERKERGECRHTKARRVPTSCWQRRARSGGIKARPLATASTADVLPLPDRSAILNSMVQYPTTVDRAFAALADPTRRAVLERLGAGSATISELAEPFGMSLTGMKKHIRLLEEANLVATEKVGRARRCALVPYAFEGISTWLQRLDRFAQVVERTKGAR